MISKWPLTGSNLSLILCQLFHLTNEELQCMNDNWFMICKVWLPTWISRGQHVWLVQIKWIYSLIVFCGVAATVACWFCSVSHCGYEWLCSNATQWYDCVQCAARIYRSSHKEQRFKAKQSSFLRYSNPNVNSYVLQRPALQLRPVDRFPVEFHLKCL